MAELIHGTVTIVLPDGVELPADAGHLSPADKRKLPKARKGIGLACSLAAAELEKSDGTFSVPNVDPAALRAAGILAEKMDEIIEDVEVSLETLCQANLIDDADAFNMLRKVNDQVKSQSKFDPSIATRFTAVTEYFASSGRPSGDSSK